MFFQSEERLCDKAGKFHPRSDSASHRPPLGQQLFLIVAAISLAWGLLYTLRPSYSVDGSIESLSTRSYPWQIGPRFDLTIKTGAGRKVLFRALQGRCEGSGRQFSACAKPELPSGGSIRLVGHGFSDPNTCVSPPGLRTMDLTCLRSLDHICAIQVNGRPVVDGWVSSPNYFVLYGLVAAGVLILAFSQWKLSRLSLKTVIVYLVISVACVVSGESTF
jgi:hypothetical protein